MASTFVHCRTIASSSSSTSTRATPHASPSTTRPMRVDMPQNQSYWASISSDIEAHLQQAVPIRQPSITEAMNKVIFSTPRSTASALCIAACEAVGGNRDQAVAAASAIHLMYVTESFFYDHHIAAHKSMSTAHHDVSITRFGILPLSYGLLAQSDDSMGTNSDKILRAIIEITRAMGPQGVVDGQYWKMLCQGSYGDEVCHIGWIDHVCEKIDGGLYSCGAACGAILGGGDEDEIENLRRFGLYVGMINGIMTRGIELGRTEKDTQGMVEDLKILAFRELDCFKDRDVEALKSLVNVS